MKGGVAEEGRRRTILRPFCENDKILVHVVIFEKNSFKGGELRHAK